MTTTDLARTDPSERDIAAPDPEAAAGALAEILATGDLSKLSNEQRVAHYLRTCRSLGLNALSRPFDWLLLDGRLVFYPNKSCAEQLRRLHHISVKVTRRDIVGDMFVVEVEGRTPTGRTDEASKYVPLKDSRGNRLTGNLLANAFAKAETGAKRRLVLSMIGLASAPDPEDVASVRYVIVDGSGRVLERPTDEQKALAADPGMAKMLGLPVYEDAGADGSQVLDGLPDQRVRPEELERPPAPATRATFKASEEDIKRWLGAWFASVRGTSLDDDEARHRYVAAWTADEWPKAKRTDSLRTAFARMTSAEAGDFLAHVREIAEDERRDLLAQSYQNMPDPEATGDPVRDAFTLTGAPGERDDDTDPAF